MLAHLKKGEGGWTRFVGFHFFFQLWGEEEGGKPTTSFIALPPTASLSIYKMQILQFSSSLNHIYIIPHFLLLFRCDLQDEVLRDALRPGGRRRWRFLQRWQWLWQNEKMNDRMLSHMGCFRWRFVRRWQWSRRNEKMKTRCYLIHSIRKKMKICIDC